MSTQTGKTPMSVGAFRVEQEVTIQGTPARVFDALTKEVSAWWGMPHMYSEEARDIILEPNVGGRLFEDWGNGEGVLYATVTIARRPEWLRLTGPIGMRGAVAGVVDTRSSPKGRRRWSASPTGWSAKSPARQKRTTTAAGRLCSANA